MAERLLCNQYAANQREDGSFGNRFYDGDWSGPIAAKPDPRFGPFKEGDACCNFHGPLGLFHLKSYLAAGLERGVFVNFPFDFTSKVKSNGRDWQVTVRTVPSSSASEMAVDVDLAPVDSSGDARTTLWFRVPDWAKGVKRIGLYGKETRPAVENGYLRIDGDFRAGGIVHIILQSGLTMEGWRFHESALQPGRTARFRNVSIFAGPRILAADAPLSTSGRPTILATVDAQGRLGFPSGKAGKFITVSLPASDVEQSRLAAAFKSAPAIELRPWLELPREHRAVFSFDVVVVPADAIPGAPSTHK